MKKGNLRYLVVWAGLIVVILIVLVGIIGSMNSTQPTYADIVEYFRNIGTDKEAVKEFSLDADNLLIIKTTEGKELSFRLQDRDIFYEDCYVYVREYNALVAASENEDDNEEAGTDVTDPDTDTKKLKPIKYNFTEPKVIPWYVHYLPYIIVIVLLVAFWFFYIRQSSNGTGAGKINSFGRARAKVAPADGKNKVLFTDVAGADEEKEELVEIVDFLREPSKFTKLGAKIPHGVLLVGPPGTGKTLLAKAVAGEAGVPFYSISGSDFVEMYVGVGASRVRDLFETARKSPASIVFIDEIDAVGRHRGAGLGGGHDEREQTLNQLLVEMDGFAGNEGVIVMAATNRPDILDPALLRPGRFDRQITVNYPDINGREEILRIHAKNKPLASDINLTTVAKATVGFTGADLANLLNEAALLAARRGRSIICMDDIENATMKIIVGTQKKSMKMTEAEKRKTAYHEAGHAVVSYVLPTQDPVHQISIIPSGKALGYTLNLPQEDKYSVYRNELREEITVLLAGRAAERIIFDDFSGGASNDIERATGIARKMVTKLGMSDSLGPVVYGTDQGEVFLGRDFSNNADYSDLTATKIDDEIRNIIDAAYDEAVRIINENIDKLHFITEYLLAHEIIEESQFDAIMKGNPTVEELEHMESERLKRNRVENEEQERKNREKLEAERQAAALKAKELEEKLNQENQSTGNDSGSASSDNTESDSNKDGNEAEKSDDKDEAEANTGSGHDDDPFNTGE